MTYRGLPNKRQYANRRDEGLGPPKATFLMKSRAQPLAYQ